MKCRAEEEKVDFYKLSTSICIMLNYKELKSPGCNFKVFMIIQNWTFRFGEAEKNRLVTGREKYFFGVFSKKTENVKIH